MYVAMTRARSTVTLLASENNDGAYGEFCFDARARSIHLEFNERFTSSELYTHDF